ncbi:MAG: hypothetical protein ABIK44_04810 [candidate division WOR-3 bacterium]
MWWTHGMYTDVIKYRKSADFGETWGPIIQLTSLEPSFIYSDSRFPKITADPQGRHVVFGDSRAVEGLSVWYKQNPNDDQAGGGQSAGTTPTEPLSLTVWPNPTRGSVTIHLASGPVRMTAVTVTDVQGRLVRRLLCSGTEIRWDCRDEHGRQVPAGVYHLEALGPASRTRTQVLVLR